MSASSCVADDRTGIVGSCDATPRPTFRTRRERILRTATRPVTRNRSKPVRLFCSPTDQFPTAGPTLAPGPSHLLLASLGACRCVTARWYARQKNPLADVRLEPWRWKIHAKIAPTARPKSAQNAQTCNRFVSNDVPQGRGVTSGIALGSTSGVAAGGICRMGDGVGISSGVRVSPLFVCNTPPESITSSTR